MNKLRLSVLLLGACALFSGACGSADDPSTTADAAPAQGACDPVAQAGCAVGQKCAWLEVAAREFRTGCAPDGDVALGGTCESGPPGETTGFDNCQAGSHCLAGVCEPICSAQPNSCTAGACQIYGDLFNGPSSAIGVCAALCDPLAQDCTRPADGCYLDTLTGNATCSVVADTVKDIRQDQPCVIDPGTPNMQCYRNGCPKGYVAANSAEGATSQVCVKLCSPVPQSVGNADSLQGDPNGITCSSADDPNITANHECRFINTFYDNTGAVSSAVGFCIDRTKWYGGQSCAESDPSSPDTFVYGCSPKEAAPAALRQSVPRDRASGDLDALIHASSTVLGPR